MGFESPQNNFNDIESERTVAKAAVRSSASESYQLSFSVWESQESTEEKPVLFYERNGFVFRVDLDLHNEPLVVVTLDTKRPESLEKDWRVLKEEVEKQAKEELYRRRAAYGEKYFS